MKLAAETQHPSLQKRPNPGAIRAFFLAAGVHAAFFALIVFGVTWQVSPTAPLVAELWDKLPPAKTAARPEPPKPEPEPPKPEPPRPDPPKPEPRPDPPKPAPAKPPEKKTLDPPKPDPAIAEKAEREKREKARKEKLQREMEEKKQEDARRKREQEDAARKKAEEERVRRETERVRAEAAARRQSEVDKYVREIQNKIRGKANVPDNVTGNPEVHLRLRILPGGEVLEATVTKSSGNRAYDAAIERAIRSAQPLPVPPPDSELFPQFRDLNLIIRHER